MQAIVRGMILFYRSAISPYLGRNCRFRPSCSEYALRALDLHGTLAGLGLGALRILRCNRLFRGGYDPVPPAQKKPGRAAAAGGRSPVSDG